MKILKYFFLAAILAAFAVGCSDENPFNSFRNPLKDGELDLPGDWTEWVIYDGELRTGGGVMFYTSDHGQTLDLFNTDNPFSKKYCIKYSWNGQKVKDYENDVWQDDWAGWGLIAGREYYEYEDVSRDLSDSGYTKITLRARGSGQVRFESPDGAYTSNAPNDTTGNIQLTDEWKEYEMNFTAGSVVRDFLKIIFNDGAATVYIDDITYK